MDLGSTGRVLGSNCSILVFLFVWFLSLPPPLRLLTPTLQTFQPQNLHLKPTVWVPVYHSVCSLVPALKCEHGYPSTSGQERKDDGTRGCRVVLGTSTTG